MKRCVVYCISIIIAVLISMSSWAADERKKVVVLPFSIHSSEDINYVRGGIWDMLMSRLSASGKMDVIDKHTVSEALKKAGGKELTVADVYGLGKKIDVDYVVWGSITKIGNSISLDGKLMDVATYKTPVGVFEQCQGMDEVIPKLSVFSEKINGHILGIVVSPVTLPAAGVTPVRQTSKTTLPPGLQATDALKSQEGTFTSIINPEFITGIGPLDRKGFWMSKRIAGQFDGMDIGDVNNDGLNEVVVIDSHAITIYQVEGKDLKQLYKLTGKSYEQYLSVDVADINGNAIPEIIVSSVEGSSRVLNSFVLEYKDKKFETVASGLKWFLRVIKTGRGTPILLGQEKGIDTPFSRPIYQIGWKGKTYRKIERMKIPEGLSVYGLTVDSITEGGPRRVIALDENDHINIYKQTEKNIERIHIIGRGDELLWKSEEVFGGTSNAIVVGEENAGKGNSWDEGGVTYINVRLHTYDINEDGKNEIIIVRNMSPAGRTLHNTKFFTKSEIYNLEWDGMGLVQNWKTKKIQGYVADYQFKDIDNDGENEVVLAIRLSLRRSIIVAYDLNV